MDVQDGEEKVGSVQLCLVNEVLAVRVDDARREGSFLGEEGDLRLYAID